MDRKWIARGLVCAGLGLLLAAWPASGQNDQVTINEQPTAEQRLAEVNELRRAGRQDAAAELVQELIDQSQLKLVGVGQGKYTDAERWGREELHRDPALGQAYRQRFSATATRALEQAQASDSPVRDLGEVYRRYSVTPAALLAGLELSGRLLEAGDAAAAGVLLDELARHPDRNTQLGRLETLRGAASVYTYDSDQFEASTQRLIELGLKDQAAWLAQLVETLGPGALSGHPGLMDAGPKPDELRVSLWDQPLGNVERSGNWMRDIGVLPLMTPSQVLINNGRQVVAMDRASGQRLWAYPADDTAEVIRPLSGPRWYDTRSVAIGRGAVCAVLGECYGIGQVRDPYVHPNRLACMNEITGQVRWERRAGILNQDEPTQGDDRRLGRANLQHTHFVGTPIVARGQVFTLLRRTSNAGAQTTWLMSYDLEDGSLRWFRHLALLSLTEVLSNNVFPELVRHGDTLYITDSIATVAAIDIHNGGYRWLRVLPGDIRQTNRQSSTSSNKGMLTPPVLTRAGLLVPLALNRQRLVLLDPTDGSTLQTFENDPKIGNARYLMDGGDGAVVVSDTSVAYWNADETKVVWSFTFAATETAQGRGDVTKRFVVVPTSQRLVVLDRATGELIDEVDTPGGIVSVQDSELLISRDERLYSYTSWHRAYQRLVDRVKEQPTDPTAGLALASLAIRQGEKTQAVLQGVGYALDAIALQPPEQAVLTRQRVFDQLRGLAQQPEIMDDTTRGLLYDRLALATQTAAQEVAYHLDVGRYYARLGEPDRAVEHFQAVVADPSFTSQPYESGGLTRSAGAVAQQEIYTLIKAHGRSVYRRYDALAHARLAELKAEGQNDAAALAMIARRYPMSLAAVEALLEAGRSFEKQEQKIAAVGLYQQALVRAGRTQQRQIAVGRLLRFYLNEGRPEDALALLEREARQHPDLYPIESDKPVSHAAWRERIAQSQAQRKPAVLPDLSSQLSQPYLLPGKLVAPAPGIDALSLKGRLLLQHDDGTLTCYTPAQPKQPLWTADLPVDARRWVVLADGDEQILLWSPDVLRVAALDPADGQTLWSTALGFEHGPQAELDLARDMWQGHVHYAVSDSAVCFGQRSSAKLVTIDRAAGGVLWRSELAMAELTAMDADNWTLAAAGRIGQVQHHLSSGQLALLNLFTGEPMTDTPELRVNVSPFQVRLNGGRAILCGPSKVSAVDSQSGSALWTKTFTQTRLTGITALTDTLLAVDSGDGQVHVMDLSNSGERIGSVLVRGRADPPDTSLQAVGDQIWVRSGQGLFRLGASPVMQWRDAVTLTYKRPYRALVGQSHVAMIAATNEENDPDRIAAPGAPASYGLFLFDRDNGRLISQYTIGPIEGQLDPRGAVLFDRGLAVPVGWETLVVPGETP